jgi:hypothetical protein
MGMGSQCKIKRRSLTDFGFRPDCTAMTFDNFFDEGESNAGTFFPCALTALQALKDTEDFFVELWSNAFTVVFYIKHIFGFDPIGRDVCCQTSDFYGFLRFVIVFDGVGPALLFEFIFPLYLSD